MKINKPFLRGHFHQAMFFVALGAIGPLIGKSKEGIEYVSYAIYSFGLLVMFGMSALYHRINWSQRSRSMMRKFDHSAIYLMIAGSMTPIALLLLKGREGTTVLIAIWVVAFFGIIKSLFLTNLPKIINTILFLVAGYLIVPHLPLLFEKLGVAKFTLIVIGGAAYTLGALSYGLKFPKFNPRVFGYHETFHALVSVGAILHFIVIYNI